MCIRDRPLVATMLLVTICYLCLQNIYNFAAGITCKKALIYQIPGGFTFFPGDFPQNTVRINTVLRPIYRLLRNVMLAVTRIVASSTKRTQVQATTNDQSQLGLSRLRIGIPGRGPSLNKRSAIAGDAAAKHTADIDDKSRFIISCSS